MKKIAVKTCNKLKLLNLSKLYKTNNINNLSKIIKIYKLILLLNIIFIINMSFVYSHENLNVNNSLQVNTNENNIKDSLLLSKRFGINGFYSFIFNNSNFRKIPGTDNCCKNYFGNLGFGTQINAYFEIPITTKYGFGSRVGWQINKNEFIEPDNQLLIIDGVETTGKFNHFLNTTFNYVTLEPYFYYTPIDYLNLSINLGLNYNLLSEYSQKEEIDPSLLKGTFKDETNPGQRQRNVFNGEIKDINTIITNMGFGISYELPMNKTNTLKLVPEINFKYNFTNIIKDSIWNQYSINLGLGIKYYDYQYYVEPVLPPTPPREPPMIMSFALPIKPPIIEAEVNAYEKDNKGENIESRGLKLEEFVKFSLKPLLNYVFFDYNSSEIPNRYILLNTDSISKFNIDKLTNLDIIDTYYNIINIIGFRLKNYKETKIKLLGSNSNKNDEFNNLNLSKNRAEIIKNYLVDKWGIEESRIEVDYRNLPKEASRDDVEYGQKENSRVEILSNNEEISDPIIVNDTLRTFDEKDINFTAKINSSTKIQNISLKIYQDDENLFFSKNLINDTLSFYSWNWKIQEDFDLKSTNPIYYFIEVEDELGQIFKTFKKILPINRISIDVKRLEKIKDVEYENYSLILFDYGKTDLATEHKKVVDFVKSRIKDNSKINIVGYTDSMGDDAINLKISTLRAKATYKRLDIKNATYEGKGEKELLFENTLPEGRFYCRTVVINVENIID